MSVFFSIFFLCLAFIFIGMYIVETNETYEWKFATGFWVSTTLSLMFFCIILIVEIIKLKTLLLQ